MEEIIDDIINELGLDCLNTYSQGYLVNKPTFADLVTQIMNGDRSVSEIIISQVSNIIASECFGTKELFVGIFSFVFIAAIFNKITSSKNTYLNSVSFLMVYGALMVLLMDSINGLELVLTNTIDGLIGFMNLLIPVYATTLIVTGNLSTASAYYVFSFGCIYLVEWIAKLVLIPATQIFLFLQFINNMFEEESISKLAELIEKLIRFALKLMTGIVIGMGSVESIIASTKDQVANSMALKAVSVVPGVGNVVSAAGETVLSCGMLIKNCIGIVGVIVLLAIILAPLIKIGVYFAGYKLVAAIVQPIADKRIVGGVNGTARACELYFNILCHMGIMFIITVSIICIGVGSYK